jgi:hypothetical protein
MAYTPELSQLGSATLRRLAWFRGKPMPKSLEDLIGFAAVKMAEVKPGEVCSNARIKASARNVLQIPPQRITIPLTPNISTCIGMLDTSTISDCLSFSRLNPMEIIRTDTKMLHIFYRFFTTSPRIVFVL